MTVSRPTGRFRHALALGLTALAVLVGGCSLPGAAAPTPVPTATPPPSVASSAPPSAVPAASVPASASPATATATATATAMPVPTATATLGATPTVAATPSARPATPTGVATPATPVPPTVGTPVGGTQTLRDATLACELTVPASYRPAATPGGAASADGKVAVALQALTVGPTDTLDDLTLPFVGAFIPTVAGYEQVAVIRLADSLRIDFRGGLPQPGAGTLYFKQFDATICAVTMFVANDAGIAVETLVETLIKTLRPRGVGYWEGEAEG